MIIDATLIASAARPKQEITMKEYGKEEEVEYQMEGNSLSKDEDALPCTPFLPLPSCPSRHPQGLSNTACQNAFQVGAIL